MPGADGTEHRFRLKDYRQRVSPLFRGAVLIARAKSELFLYNRLFLPELCHTSSLCRCAAVSVILLSGKAEAENTHQLRVIPVCLTQLHIKRDCFTYDC